MSERHSVLIVDDEPNILLSLQFLMKNAGYEVRTAKDGDEALAEMEKAAPDLVLLDVMMPKRDGFDVCQKIRVESELEGCAHYHAHGQGATHRAREGAGARRGRLHHQTVLDQGCDRARGVDTRRFPENN